MTDPLEACLQELNEAVAERDVAIAHAELYETDNHWRDVAIKEIVVYKLRHKYNALVIAYAERTD